MTGADHHSDVRVGDQQRDRAASLLAQALALGYLPRAEFDDRLGRVVAAPTEAALAAELRDLPTAELRRGDPARRARIATVARRTVRVHAAAAGGVGVLLVSIWLTIALTADVWYPWPIWPAIGMALGVAGHATLVHLFLRRRP